MNNENVYTLECTENNIRIDKFIQIDSVTRARIQSLIEDGYVKVNSNVCTKTNKKLKAGDIVDVLVPPPTEYKVVAEDIPLDIVYEDDSLLVVNKPQGMVVHPANGNYNGTLVNALMHHCKNSLSGINGVMRPGIVHRIDKDTSGLLVVAKTNDAHISLAKQIKDKTVTREYVCIANGIISTKKGVIDAPVGRHPSSRLKMAVTEKNSKNAVTHFEVLEYFNNATYLKCRLETGRTHQIRVHLQFIGHSILGDHVYTQKNPYNLKGQALHARTLGFIHPVTGEYMEFSAPIPDDFENLLNKLRNS